MGSNQPNHSLPQKPPGVARNTSGFRPPGAFGFTPRSVARNQASAASASFRNAATSYTPSASAGPQYNASYGGNTAGPSAYSQQAYAGGYGQGYDNNNYGQQHQSYSGAQSFNSGYQTGSSNNHSGSHGQASDQDAQQYLEWQSAYTGNSTEAPNPSSNSQLPTSSAATGTHATNTAKVDPRIDNQQATPSTNDGKPKTREEELAEEGWDKDQWRLFVGNLAGEVTDDTLLKAFAAFPSISKVKVIRDKTTTKSKGYGFVQFTSADEFLKAGREMNQKYIGSHPVTVKRAKDDFYKEEKDKHKTKHPLFRTKEEMRKKNKNKKNKRNHEQEDYSEAGNGMSTNAGVASYSANAEHYDNKVIHANTNAGVQKSKKGHKTKDGLNVLG